MTSFRLDMYVPQSIWNFSVIDDEPGRPFLNWNTSFLHMTQRTHFISLVIFIPATEFTSSLSYYFFSIQNQLPIFKKEQYLTRKVNLINSSIEKKSSNLKKNSMIIRCHWVFYKNRKTFFTIFFCIQFEWCGNVKNMICRRFLFVSFAFVSVESMRQKEKAIQCAMNFREKHK